MMLAPARQQHEMIDTGDLRGFAERLQLLHGAGERQVREVAAYLGAPSHIVHKPPTADLESLSPQKADEAALGMSYDQIDDFLEGKSVDSQVAKKLVGIFEKTQHKRVPIPTIYD